jgi:hypothetical protein
MIDIRCMFGFHRWDGIMSDNGTRCARCGRFYGIVDGLKSGALIGVAIIAMLWLLAGCACGIRTTPPGGGQGGSTLSAELARFGAYGLWIGGAILGMGVLLRIGRIASFAASFVNPIAGMLGLAGGIASVATIATEVGGTAAALGLAALWLADHPSLVPWAGGIAALAFGFRHRRNVRRWLRLGPPAGATSNNKPE